MPASPLFSHRGQYVCMPCTAHDPGPYVVTHTVGTLCPRPFYACAPERPRTYVGGEPTWVCRRCSGAWGHGVVTHPADQECPRKVADREYWDENAKLKRIQQTLQHAIDTRDRSNAMLQREVDRLRRKFDAVRDILDAPNATDRTV